MIVKTITNQTNMMHVAGDRQQATDTRLTRSYHCVLVDIMFFIGDIMFGVFGVQFVVDDVVDVSDAQFVFDAGMFVVPFRDVCES